MNYRWIYVPIAALMMAATFPGRTQGLGMVTESLLRDMQMDRTLYASYNLWATLLGSLFCFPAGYWLDRLGCRKVLTVILILLGTTVFAMSMVRENHFAFFLVLLLSRGLGQSALSVVSIALISKYFSKRQLSWSMGVYSLLVTIFFMLCFAVMGGVLRSSVSWREAWFGIGLVLIFFCVPITLLFVRSPTVQNEDGLETENHGIPFRKALRSAAFWVFALSASFYGLVVSGIGLFNESILAERGFDTAMYHRLLVLPIPFGLLCNLLAGWICRYFRIHYVLAGALLPMSAALFLFPFISTVPQVYAYAILMGGTGGAVTVLFFSAWGQLFGPFEVGRIQGAAQMSTVFASALGPLLFALSYRWTATYTPVFMLSGVLTLFLALWACCIKLPQNDVKTESESEV